MVWSSRSTRPWTDTGRGQSRTSQGRLSVVCGWYYCGFLPCDCKNIVCQLHLAKTDPRSSGTVSLWQLSFLLNDWFIGWLVCNFIDWMIDWLINLIWFDWLIHTLFCWLICWLLHWLTDLLNAEFIDWLIHLFIVSLIKSLIDWFINWSIDWFIHSFMHALCHRLTSPLSDNNNGTLYHYAVLCICDEVC